MSSSIRLGKLEKFIREQARAKLSASIDADFKAALSRAANDPDCKVTIAGVTAPRSGLKAEKVLTDLRTSIFKAGVGKAEDEAIEEFLQRQQPVISLEQLLFPEMIKISPAQDHMPADAKGHVAVLMPALRLMYDAREPKVAEDWKKAVAAGAATDLFGFKDWQLWSDKEAELTIRRDRHSPATDTNFFPHTPTNRIYWTRTTYASSPSDCAIDVDFFNGGVNCVHQGGGGFVRAVRRVPASQ